MANDQIKTTEPAKQWERHRYTRQVCPRCRGTGHYETQGDLHKSGGIVPCDHWGWKEVTHAD